MTQTSTTPPSSNQPAATQLTGRLLPERRLHPGSQRTSNMRALVVAVAMMAVVVVLATRLSGHADEAASPIYGVKMPPGYRDWKMIAVDHLLLAGKSDQLRAQLGNDIAIKAYRQGTIPFPDGSIIAAIHWTRVPSEDNNKVLNGPFPGSQSFVIGSIVNVQFMVKDSKKYAATGGWGFADFKDGKPGDKALHETCFPCHMPAKDRDYVFTRYAP